MKLYRKTYATINLKHIKENVATIIKHYPNYQYYFGVVKADCYGHGIKSVSSIIEGGCNYLAVALLEEALEIRKKFPQIPILCLGIIPIEYMEICQKNHITITVSSYDYAFKLKFPIKVHIKLNTGMNRLGISSLEELKKTIEILKKKHIQIEGIYTHVYNALNKEDTMEQIQKYEYLVQNIDRSNISIFHIAASDALVYPKLPFVNGCRLGIIMYGFTQDHLSLQSTFSLQSKVIQINELKPNDRLGYNGIYTASKKEKIAVIPVGYADGIIRENKGRFVYINNKKYEIVGNICMDMLFIKIDDQVHIGDDVFLLKDKEHIKEVATYLHTIPYEVICSIGKRVPRIYKN